MGNQSLIKGAAVAAPKFNDIGAVVNKTASAIGDYYQARAAELDKTETMLGMSQARLGAANAARDAATNSIIGGVTGLASSVLPAIPGLGELAPDGSSSFMSNMMGK